MPVDQKPQKHAAAVAEAVTRQALARHIAHRMTATASSAVLAFPVAISTAASTVALLPCPCAQWM